MVATEDSSVIPSELIPDIGQQPNATRLTNSSEDPNRVKCDVSIWFGIGRYVFFYLMAWLPNHGKGGELFRGNRAKPGLYSFWCG